jgi:hypothetical protein
MSKTVKKLPKKAVDDLLTGLNSGAIKPTNGTSKADVIKAIELVKSQGHVTSGKGGGRGGIAQTAEMQNYVTAFEAFNTKNCPKGHFIDTNGKKRTPKLYMPQPKTKKA